LRFGFDPPFVVAVGDHTIHLHGVIDRVDRNRAGSLRVIDYKTGGSHLGKRDLFSGRKLQLPLYALAAGEAFDGEVVDGLYYHIGRDGAKGMARLLTIDGRDNQDGVGVAVRVACGHLEDIFDRLGQGDFPSQPLGGKCANYCAAAPWCWHYHPEWTGAG
jgi:hypothetical protein